MAQYSEYTNAASARAGDSWTGYWSADSPELSTDTTTVTVITDKLLIANNPSQVNRWYGRPVLKRLADKLWIMVYANSEAHHTLTWSQLHVRFSRNYGETWTAEDKYFDDTSITNFPMYPPTCVPGENANGPGEGWIIQCTDSPLHLLLHMWDSSYQGYNNGTWQSESLDGGRSWSVPEKILWVNNTGTANEDDRTFSTCQTYIYNNIIYVTAREYEIDASQESSRTWFGKSEDNGNTWELLSLMSAFSDKTNEAGIEYVGNNTIISCIRNFRGPQAYYTKSVNMGVTWAVLTEVQGTVDVWSRPRVYTRSHIKGTDNWWNDPLVICHGFVHVNGEVGDSTPRRLAVWISTDHGDTFSAPIYLKAQGYDGGYGDLLYNPVTNEYVTLQYYAPTSLLDGEIRQINWTLT